MTLVESVGMCSPLGNYVDSCAAFKSGLSNISDIQDYDIFCKGEEEPEQIKGHKVPVVTYGLSATARYVVLAYEALNDLKRNSNIFTSLKTINLCLVIPDPVLRGVEREDMMGNTNKELGRSLGNSVFKSLLKLHSGPSIKEVSIFSGDIGVVEALNFIQDTIQARNNEIWLYISVDSLVDLRSLEIMYGENRLKTTTNTDGIIPGEIGVALLFVSENIFSKSKVLADVSAVLMVNEDSSYFDDKPPSGSRIVRALADYVRQKPVDPPQKVVLLSDFDGNRNKAVELGNVLTGLGSIPYIDQERLQYVLPAEGYGNVGCAFIGLSIALAAWFGQRKHFDSVSYFILCGTESTERILVHLTIPSRGI